MASVPATDLERCDMTATSTHVTARCMRAVRLLSSLALSWVLLAQPAFAGLSVYTDGTTSPPSPAANQRTVDFSTTTLAHEQSAAKLSYSASVGACTKVLFVCINSAGSVSYTSSSSLLGFSGNVMSLTSGTTPNPTSVTIQFTNPTPYVGFLWGVEFVAQNSMLVNITLADNSVVTLKNCSDTNNAQCMAKYVSSNWWTTVYNGLLGWLLGDVVEYFSVYVQYEPDNGVKIKSIQFVTYACSGCGFLSGTTSQDFKVDQLTYVDAAAVPHHLEVTTTSATVGQGVNTTFTIKACGDASCSVPYINGVSGSLQLSGSGITATYPSGAAFSIPAGPNNSTTVVASLSPSGTATVALTGYSPTPSNTPKYFCGLGQAAASGNSCTLTIGQTLHHLALTAASNAGITCTPVVYTIQACADDACTTPYTDGITGNLTVTGATVNYPTGQEFSIPASSSSTTISAHVTSAGTATAALSSLSVSPSNTPNVYCGMGASASSGGSCSTNMVSSALLFDVPHHASETSQAITVSAVRASDNAAVCAPAFASVSKNVTFKCSYGNPTSGTKPVRVGGTSLNAGNNSDAVCDGAGHSVSLTFNSSGVASTTVQYADVGQMGLSASYAGSGSDAGLSMVGSDTFIVAPYSLVPTSWTPGPMTAGSDFAVTLTARNVLGNTTPNFGQELSPAMVDVYFSKTEPSGSGASDGVFASSMSSFTNGEGVLTASWSEVGRVDLLVEMHNRDYQGSGLNASGATGSSGAVGPFVADHFTTEEVTQGCGSFTYSGQPFSVKIYARNASGEQLLNYDGTVDTSPSFAKAATLTGLGLTGTLSNASVAASRFDGGVAVLTTPSFAFTNKLTASGSLTLRATEDANPSVSSNGHTEEGVLVRSGRVRLSNAFGSDKGALEIPVRTEYWSGRSWVINDADSCTHIPASAVALSNYTTNQGTAAAWTTSASSGIAISGGLANPVFELTAPTPALTGTVDVALNLGSTSADNACLGAHPSTTGASFTWLRSRNGNCATSYDRDPSARATFGIYTPESQRTIHVRPIQ